MATSVTRINGTCSLDRGYSFYADVTIDDTIINNSYFNVKIECYVVNGSLRTNSSGWTKYIRINDVDDESWTNQTINTTIVSANGGKLKVIEKTFNVPITMQTIGIYGYLDKSSFTAYDMGTCIVNDYVSMPKVQSTWNSSLLSIPDITQSFTLPINKYVNDYYNVVEVRNSNNTTLIKTINNAVNGTSVTFNSSELNTIYSIDNNPNQLPLRFYMDLKTYTSSSMTTQIGSTQRLTCEAYLIGGSPTATITIVEQNANVISVLGSSTSDKIIKNASELLFTIDATAYNGASISSVKVNDVSATYDSDNQVYVLDASNITTDNFTIKIIDTRTKWIEYYFYYTLLDYIQPSIHSNWTIERATQVSSDLVLNAIIDAYNDTIDTGITNSVVVQYSLDNSTWTTISSSSYTYADNKITISNLTLSNLISYQNTGTFYLKAYDLLSTSLDNNPIAKGVETFSYGENDFQINGDLIVCDEDGDNPVNILKGYSTSEKQIGYWINGEPLYRKVIDLGSLPNGSQKSVSHNASIDKPINCYGYVYNSGTSVGFTIPMTSIYLWCDRTNVVVYPTSDRTSFTGTAVIEYTKTSV